MMKKLLVVVVLMALAVGTSGTCFAFVPNVAGAGTLGFAQPTGIIPVIPPPPPPPPTKIGAGDQTTGIIPVIPPPPPPPPTKLKQTTGIIPVIPPPPPPPPTK